MIINIMDYNSIYQRQLEYNQYLESQKENFIDLTVNDKGDNNSVFEFSKILFSKYKNNLDIDFSGILTDEYMQTVDIFCMIIELILYGIDFLSNKQIMIFDLESTDDLFYDLKKYLQSCGFDFKVSETFFDKKPILYRETNNYFIEILPCPSKFLRVTGWYLLNYRLIENNKIKNHATLKLKDYKAFYINKNNKIITIEINYTNHLLKNQ